MAIPYNNAIPQATDQISQSQPLIFQNFAGIDQLIGIDHASFASGNAGFHNKVTLPDQTASLPTFGGTNDGIYAKVNATSTKNEIYIHKDGIAIDYPITFSNLDANSIGYFYLPNGLLVNTGIANTSLGTGTNMFIKPYKSGTKPVVIATAKVTSAVLTVIAINPGATPDTSYIAYSWVNGVLATANYYFVAIGTPP